MRLRGLWLAAQFNGAGEVGISSCHVANPKLRFAAIVQGTRIVWLKVNHFIVVPDGTMVLAKVRVGQTTIAKGFNQLVSGDPITRMNHRRTRFEDTRRLTLLTTFSILIKCLRLCGARN